MAIAIVSFPIKMADLSIAMLDYQKVCIYIYVYIHISIHIHMYIYIYIYVHTNNSDISSTMVFPIFILQIVNGSLKVSKQFNSLHDLTPDISDLNNHLNDVFLQVPSGSQLGTPPGSGVHLGCTWTGSQREALQQ